MARILIVAGLALLAGISRYAFWAPRLVQPSDFAQLWFAARALLAGENPYAQIGPGLAFDWAYPLVYPGPAIVLALPFAPFSLPVADALFVSLGVGVLAWAFTRERLNDPKLLVFMSVAVFAAIPQSQWSMLLTGAALLPSISWLAVAKPSLGLALWLAYPNRIALIGGAIVGVVSLVLLPTWPRDWLAALPAAPARSLVLWNWGGPLILLGLLRWRDPAARLVVALAAIPMTPHLYEAVPLFLLVRRLEEGIVLVVLLFVATAQCAVPFNSWEAYWAIRADVLVWYVYLPVTGWILIRGLLDAQGNLATARPDGPDRDVVRAGLPLQG